METRPPTPSIALVVSSIIVIVACFYGASAALASLVAWDPCSVIGAAILAPLPLVLGVQQYRGTFRRNASAARVAAVLLFIAGGMPLIVVVAGVADMIGKGDFYFPLRFLAPILAFSTTVALAGWLNLQWSRRLLASPIVQENLALPSRFTLKELLGSVAVIAAMFALIAQLSKSAPVQFAEHATRSEAGLGLPDNAIDVSYCRGFRGTIAYEFTTDEPHFRQWIADGIGSLESQAANVPVKPIVEPVSINRYYALMPMPSGPRTITVSSGLSYRWHYLDRGVEAVFDSSTNRAYYYANYH